MWVPVKAPRGSQIPGGGVTCGCGPPNRGAGNQLQSSTRAARTPNCCVDISLASLYYCFLNSKNLVAHMGL